jgi:uncharacterized secreted protein with C-terminal beta-propeller domain
MESFIEKVVMKNKIFRNDNSQQRIGVYMEDASPMAVGISASATKVSNVTNTNVQVSGVDEDDILKHNNNHIFYIRDNRVFIKSFDEVLKKSNIKREIQTFKYNKDVYLKSLYLFKDKLVVIANSNHFYGIYRMIAPMYNNESKIYIEIYDISNIDTICYYY